MFNELADRFAKYGYKLPKLVFWNVNSRTKTIPMTENEMGVVLVSGFSPNYEYGDERSDRSLAALKEKQQSLRILET